jgi:hypothetical protein
MIPAIYLFCPAFAQQLGPCGCQCLMRVETVTMPAWGLGRQASVNPKTETVEDLKARRKNLHMGMLKLAKEDLHHTLQAALNAFQVLTSTSHTHCMSM